MNQAQICIKQFETSIHPYSVDHRKLREFRKGLEGNSISVNCNRSSDPSWEVEFEDGSRMMFGNPFAEEFSPFVYELK